jgi:NADPH2:quinone reductase
MTTRTIRVHAHGGPEVLQLETLDLPAPAPGECRVRHEAIGVNFVDTYFRTGLYKPPGLPFTPGVEASGVVEAVGEGVTTVAVGDRVAYGTAPVGAYAEARNVPARVLVRLPGDVAHEVAASLMVKGMTAEYLLFRTFAVQAGQWVLVHAAAGGVGALLCPWAKQLGANVVGVVGSEAKVETAKASGCDHVLLQSGDWAKQAKEVSGGGVHVVYDGVGKDTFVASLDALRPRGMLASYGQASGTIPPFDVSVLGAKGSLFLTRPSLFVYCSTPEELALSAGRVFGAVARRELRVAPPRVVPLAEASRAHEELEGRRTTGATVLVP